MSESCESSVMSSMPSIVEFNASLAEKGYFIFKNVVSADLITRLRDRIDHVIDEDLEKGQTRGQYSYLAQNKGDCFVELLEQSPLQSYVDSVLSEHAIIHSYNMIRLRPSTGNPIQNAIHRDSPRFCRPYLLALQILIMVDDFTIDNGATYLLAGSHLEEARPSDDHFYDKSERLVGKAGDAVIFDSMAWHAGGTNQTEHERRGITLVYTRPFMKQQIDLTKATHSAVLDKLSDRSRRLLGFNARVPASMDEFLLPPEQRFYKPNQG